MSARRMTRGPTAGLAVAVLVALASPAAASPPPGARTAAAAPTVSVVAPARAVLLAGGQVRLRPWVRCSGGARVYELYVAVSQGRVSQGRVSQGPGSQPTGRASAYRVPALACDGTWRRIGVRLPTTAGRLRPGPATVDALLLVTTPGGLPAASRDTTAAALVRP